MNKKINLNAICPYYSIFPLDFALKHLKKVKKNTVVLDPFCGRGTTNYAARLMGCSSYGIDNNELAVTISKSKFTSPSKKKFTALIDEILSINNHSDLPINEFFKYCYHDEVYRDLIKFREYLNQTCSTDEEIALKALILGLLHGPLGKTRANYFSNQMPRTFATKPDYSVRYWKSKNLNPPFVETRSLLLRRFDHVFRDIPEKVDGRFFKLNSFAEQGWDLPGKVDLTITSPPYFGMATYLSDQWLRLWFLGGKPEVDYRVKSQMGSGSPEQFTKKLATVWNKTAKVSNSNAQMVIRFGGIPSINRKPPFDILKNSLEMAGKWEIISKFNAGIPKSQRRQANQMIKKPGNYIEEFDLLCKLKE